MVAFCPMLRIIWARFTYRNLCSALAHGTSAEFPVPLANKYYL
jgi:hypothetical protein